MAPEELDKVLSKVYAKAKKKRMEIITSQNPLKSRWVPLNGI